MCTSLLLYLIMLKIMYIKMAKAENLLKGVTVQHYSKLDICDNEWRTDADSSESHLNDIIHDGLINYLDLWGVKRCYNPELYAFNFYIETWPFGSLDTVGKKIKTMVIGHHYYTTTEERFGVWRHDIDYWSEQSYGCSCIVGVYDLTTLDVNGLEI